MKKLIIKLLRCENSGYNKLYWVNFSKVKAISECIDSLDQFTIHFDDGTSWTVRPFKNTYSEILTKWQKL